MEDALSMLYEAILQCH